MLAPIATHARIGLAELGSSVLVRTMARAHPPTPLIQCNKLSTPFPNQPGDDDGRFNMIADSMNGVRTMDKVRIHNPENRKYYKIRPRKTKRSKKGHIVSERTVKLFHDL